MTPRAAEARRGWRVRTPSRRRAYSERRLNAEIKLGHEIIRLKAAGLLREQRHGRPKKSVLAKDTYRLSDFDVSWDLSARSQALIRTAITGSVASSARYLIKAILRGDEQVAQNWATSKALDSIRGKIASGEGIGHVVIEKFLEGVPGMNKSAIKHQLAAQA